MSAYQIRAVNFQITEALRSFCEINLGQALRGFQRRSRRPITVRLVRENDSLKPGVDEFICRVDSAESRTKVETRHFSAYGAIELAMDHLRRRLAKRSDRRRSRKRYLQRRLPDAL